MKKKSNHLFDNITITQDITQIQILSFTKFFKSTYLTQLEISQYGGRVAYSDRWTYFSIGPYGK